MAGSINDGKVPNAGVSLESARETNPTQVTSLCASAKVNSNGRIMCNVPGCSSTFILDHFLRFHILQHHKNDPGLVRWCSNEACLRATPASKETLKLAIKHFYDAHFEAIVKQKDNGFPSSQNEFASRNTKKGKYNSTRVLKEEQTTPENDDKSVSTLPGSSKGTDLNTANVNAMVTCRTGEAENLGCHECSVSWCTKVFADKHELRRHFFDKHTIRKPTAYACGVCGDLFMGTKALFNIFFHSVSQHRSEELGRASVIRSLRYLYANGDWNLDVGHYDISYLLNRTDFKCDELIQLWFEKDLNASSSPTLNKLLNASKIQFPHTSLTALGINETGGIATIANNVVDPSTNRTVMGEDLKNCLDQREEALPQQTESNPDTVDNSFDVEALFAGSLVEKDENKDECDCAEGVNPTE